MKNYLKFIAFVCGLIVTFIASLACKENAVNAFEVVMGWAGMAVSIIYFGFGFRWYNDNHDASGHRK